MKKTLNSFRSIENNLYELNKMVNSSCEISKILEEYEDYKSIELTNATRKILKSRLNNWSGGDIKRVFNIWLRDLGYSFRNNDVNYFDIRYGTVVRVDVGGDMETLLISDGLELIGKKRCFLIDLSTTNTVSVFDSIDDFIDSYEILEILGQFGDFIKIPVSDS